MKIEKRKTKQQDFRMATPKMPQALILKGSDGSLLIAPSVFSNAYLKYHESEFSSIPLIYIIIYICIKHISL
jgi:hypothetical protein